jgi:hypothetical protein
MTCSISKGFVTYHGSLECEINYNYNYLTSKRKLLEQYHALKEEALVENYLAMHCTFI